ncbi:MAG: cysteine desulfurase NifS [Clostridiales bacterium]|nr:cysteine desulfurase NifS [Clostridiales bacterium]
MKVYLDNSATTRMDDEVLKSMKPYFSDIFGNASSLHSFGREALAKVDESRALLAKLINAKTSEIYITSGGTESDNWALKGAAYAHKKEGMHIISTKIEHPAVMQTLKALEKDGFSITYLDVDKDGLVSVSDLIDAVRDDTILVSVMFANNEIGSIQPIAEIGKFCSEEGILFHTDAVQAMGSIKVDVKAMNIDMLSLSAHKFHGPKGVGLLYIKDGVRIDRLILGGHQERSYRGGTTNVAGIVGMAKALEIAVNEMEQNNAYVKKLRDYFIERVLKEIPDCKLNGGMEHRLVSNANISFDYIEGESILMLLDLEGIAVSSGSACSSGSLEPSYVILALGRKMEEAHSSIRFSFGKDNTMEETEYTIEKLKEVVAKLRSWSPLFKEIKGGTLNV